MKRVRVVRELPFAKVGEEFEIVNGVWNYAYGVMCGSVYKEENVQMIKGGWIEWVEEEPNETFIQTSGKCIKCGQYIEEDESLEEKFSDFNKHEVNIRNGKGYYSSFAQIAKEHYLDIVKEFAEESGFTMAGDEKTYLFDRVCKALEEA